ncbi:MAG: tRNA pseudouridine(55) synthase TruB [Thermodesulfobacteriota bacterium]|nr:tRNA pseudouridine(55) synthase TruB [Thermodesulfobacteriota bacterium]
MDKILLIDKPYGMTTSHITNKIKKHFGAEKAGYTGTLDPLATGVVPIFLGNLTKLIPFIDEDRKTYRVKAIIGIETETLDISGKIIKTNKVRALKTKQLQNTVASFLGEYLYVPPSYSAIKVKGTPSYKYARSGREIKLPERASTIYDITILNIKKYSFELKVDCSKGTYIRALIRDIGYRLDLGATVANLRRLSTGIFELDDSNNYFSLMKDNCANFFNIDKIFSTVEINSQLLERLKQHNNHKKIDKDFLINLSNKLSIKSKKDLNKVLTINQYPVGLINNEFDKEGRYVSSKMKLFLQKENRT